MHCDAIAAVSETSVHLGELVKFNMLMISRPNVYCNHAYDICVSVW